MRDEQSKGLEPCQSFISPLGATELLHRAVLCGNCHWPYGEHDNTRTTLEVSLSEPPARLWIELRSRHAFFVKPSPYVETVEYVRASVARRGIQQRDQRRDT